MLVVAISTYSLFASKETVLTLVKVTNLPICSSMFSKCFIFSFKWGTTYPFGQKYRKSENISSEPGLYSLIIDHTTSTVFIKETAHPSIDYA